MVIIAIEILGALSILRGFKQRNLNLYTTFTLALIVQAIILIVYRLNLNILGRIVYYSDAEEYWNDTLHLLSYGQVVGKGSQVGYAYYSALIQLLSPFRSVIWINISNILLIDLSVLLIDYLFLQYEIPPHNISSFTRVCLYNPLIIYSLCRNLKDALFLFITIVMITLYTKIKRDKKWLCIIPIILLTIIVSTIRPWGFLIMPLLSLDVILSSEQRSLARRITIAIGITVAFIAVVRFTSVWSHVVIWKPIVLESAGNLSLSEMIRAPIKIITGPGPYRAFLGNRYFLYTTESGNVFSGIGALIWWMFLSCVISNVFSFRFQADNLTLVLVSCLFIAIYSMQYGGSLELRFRGVIYILFCASFFNGLKGRLRVSTTTIIIYFLILPIGTLISA